jgi:hypothetical protein
MNKVSKDLELKEATKRAQETIANSPKAKKVSYNAKNKRLVIELTSGATAIIPANLVQIFQNASAEQIADVEIAVEGLYLRWKSLDEDLFVPNLLQGVFGTRKWMAAVNEHLSAIGAKGGASRSEAKSRASAENGKKGGRPRKIQLTAAG